MAEITTTQSFADGDTVTAAKLNNIVANASVGSEAVTNRSELTSVDGANDFLLIYDTSAAGLRKIKPNNTLDNSSVSTAKIADSAVTTSKVADSNITTSKIADSGVTTAKIADSAITTAKIAAGAVITADLADSSVTTAKINDAAVTTAKINDGSVTVAKLSNPQYTGFRNRIINGGMRIDQRNAGASVTIASNSNSYTLDRWIAHNNTDGTFTIERSTTAPSKFTNSIKFTVTATDSTIGSSQNALIAQYIEGNNFSDLAFGASSAGSVALSFWVNSNTTGTFSGSLQNSASNRSYPFSYTINSSNTWEQKNVTISGDTSGTWVTDTGVGARVWFAVAAGSSVVGASGSWSGSGLYGATGQINLMATNGNVFYITGVQLEAGSTATDFERRPIGTELALCQRYYTRSDTTSNVTSGGAAWFYGFNTSEAAGNNRFPVKMRVAPTIITFDNAGNSGSGNVHVAGGAGNITGVSANWIDTNSWNYLSKTSGWSSGQNIICSFTASAEL